MLSPLYFAVIVCEPAEAIVSVGAATRIGLEPAGEPRMATGLPSSVDPSYNDTVPVGATPLSAGEVPTT